MQSNNDEKKYRFFDPFTREAPLKDTYVGEERTESRKDTSTWMNK